MQHRHAFVWVASSGLWRRVGVAWLSVPTLQQQCVCVVLSMVFNIGVPRLRPQVLLISIYRRSWCHGAIQAGACSSSGLHDDQRCSEGVGVTTLGGAHLSYIWLVRNIALIPHGVELQVQATHSTPVMICYVVCRVGVVSSQLSCVEPFGCVPCLAQGVSLECHHWVGC